MDCRVSLVCSWSPQAHRLYGGPHRHAQVQPLRPHALTERQQQRQRHRGDVERHGVDQGTSALAAAALQPAGACSSAQSSI